MNSDLDLLVDSAKKAFQDSKSIPELENSKALFLGKNGLLSSEFKKIAGLANVEKKEFGKKLNLVKNQVENLLASRRVQLSKDEISRKISSQNIDISLPGRGCSIGKVHPLTKSLNRIVNIFKSMGFDIADGPEIETDWYNFTALNNPKDHPARSMQDTFYVDHFDQDGLNLLLRTHTSPIQVRYASSRKPPIRVIASGKTFRVDSDATHSPMFHQIEGLWVGENVSFADLKGLYKAFLKSFFETEDLKIRFRPSFFPFTEPSAEIDIMFSTGKLKGSWLEVAGAGQIHPNVMKNFGNDYEKLTGFAFGTGLERLTMLRYGVSDLRQFFENDLRFLRQF